MKEKQNIQEELKELNSGLSKLQKENNFSIPENYFEELSDNLHEKVRAARPKIFSLNNRVIKDFLRYAAILLLTSSLIVGILSRYMKNKGAENNPVTDTENYIINEYESEELIEYVVNNEYYIESNELEERYLDDIDESYLIEEL